MFSRFVRPLWKRLFSTRKILTTTAILAYSLLKNPYLLDSSPNNINEDNKANPTGKPQDDIGQNLEQYIKKLQKVDVCEGKELPEGQRKVITVKDHEGKERTIMVIRSNNKLYAFSANCPHKEPFDSDDISYSLQEGVCFNDKLFCPHHGCIFDIKSGSIENGPALLNLPIFFAEEKQGIVSVIYPLAIPTSIAPNFAERDVQDLRKTLILGGDDYATIGCINSLRQFGYQGEITVMKEGQFHYPYKKDYLHKKLINLHLNQKDNELQKKIKEELKLKNAEKKKKDKDISLVISQKQMQNYIKEQLQEKIYNKLSFYRDDWYQYYGIDFVFNNQSFRIINKQYYPYVTCNDGTKIQFDALMVATGLTQKVPIYESITVNNQKQTDVNLAQNVFCPLRSKQQHQKLACFLNKNVIKSLLILGHNVQSLEFIKELKTQFPDINIKVIDGQRDSAVSEVFGPEIEKKIVKQYTDRGIQFFIKIKEDLMFSNKFSYKNIKKREIEEIKERNKKKSKIVENPKLKYGQSVTVRLSDQLRLKADGVVIFPHHFAGNTEWVKNGKYTDFDFFHEERLSGDTFGRTDNIRIFSAGLSSANEYFLLNKRLVSNSPTIAYEQGFNVGLNMLALRIPFSYVPFESYKFFDKKLLYVGSRQFYDSILVIGSIEQWDFVAIYGIGSKVKAISASPSKSKHLTILREAFRVNCMPMFEELVNGYWSIQNLQNLIKKLNKSGCYRDLIFANRQSVHKKDLIYMERTADAGFQNDRPVIQQEYPSVEVGAGGVLKEL